VYLGRNARRVAGHVGPPDHQVGEGRYPHDGADEGDRKEALAAGRPRVGQCEPHGHQERGHQDVGEPLSRRVRPGHAQGFRLILDFGRLLVKAEEEIGD